jgi:AI-2 transport protein TqsA
MGDVTASSPSPEPPSASASSPRGVIFVVTVAATLVAALALRQLAWPGRPPPTLLALLDHGWQTMLLVIVVYILLISLLTSLIAPHYIGHAVNMSVLLGVIALVFWGWVLGPLGAILSIPITSLLKVLLIDSDPRAQWAAALIGSSHRHRH